MSTTMLLAQEAAGITDDGVVRAAALIAGGLTIGGAAVGASQGNGTINAAVLQGIARQPEARGRLVATSILGIAFVEAAYFINLAFMAVFVFVYAA